MSGRLRLERLGRAHAEVLLDIAEEFRREGDPRLEPVLDDLEAFFDLTERFAAGRDLPDDRVQQTHFLLFDGDRLVGSARLRHRLIPVLHQDGGNIGYEIRGTERGKGYGTALLALLLAEARRIELDRVLLTTERTNLPSIRVIEKNGGAPDGTSISPNTGEVMLRYWIELRP
jgi:predicted acetyltransferase